jgi:hypothetical protein
VVFVLTNHPESLDIAFARRFSFKIEFPKAQKQQQRQYWAKVMPELDEETIHQLIEKFDMSIATIEKIVGQYYIQTLVSPNLIETQTKTILNLCQNEVTNKIMHPIGFNIQNTKNTQYALQSPLPK